MRAKRPAFGDVVEVRTAKGSCYAQASHFHPTYGALLRAFPTFRAGTPDPVTRKVETWWWWDGEREWRVGPLTPEQRAFPIRGVWNDTMLVARLEAGWTPATDPT